jgi:predicted phosphodiesterase
MSKLQRFQLVIAIIVAVLAPTIGMHSCSKDRPIMPVSHPPLVAPFDITEATGGIPYCYKLLFVDPDNNNDRIEYVDLPSWLTQDDDSVFGTPPDGAPDTSFGAIVSDSLTSDTCLVQIDLISCLVVYGDTRTGHDIHRQVVAHISDVKPAAVFHVGDLVENGYLESQWTVFNEITADLRSSAVFYPALGNHEHQSQLFFDNFDLPNNEQWYSVDINFVHFVVLNTCVAIEPGTEQFLWLESDLSNIADSIRFIAVVMHHPPYSAGQHVEDERGLRQSIVPLFEQHGVDIVFVGHDHTYEHSYCGGVHYVVTGGGGAPLHNQARAHECSLLFRKVYHFCKLSAIGSSLYIKIYDTESRLIDHFYLTN